MSMSAVPYALQNATHNANLFRQAASSTIPPGGGVVSAGDFKVTQTGTPSMAVIVGVGRIWIPGTEVANVTGGNFSAQSMYYAQNESADTRTVATSDPTNPRIDVVYAYVKDQAYSGTSNLSDYAVATGTATPGATYPTNAPALPNNAIALAWIMVPAGASSIVNANITNIKNAVLGNTGDTGWITVPKLNSFTDYTATSNWLGLRYRVINGTVYVNGAVTNASSWVVNAVCGAIPSAYWPSGRVQGLNVQVDPTAGYLILAVAGAGGAAVSINATYPVG